MNQRGSVGIYLMFSVIVAAAAGYGAYHYIHEHKSEFQHEEQASTTTAPAPKPTSQTPTSPPTPVPEVPDVPMPTPVAPDERPTVESPAMQAAARAADKAVDPIVDPTDYNTPNFGIPGIVGGIEKGSVDRRFKAHAEELQSCYEHASPFDGGVRVTLEVGSNGKLTKVSLDDGDDDFRACAISVLNFSFSATRDGKPATIVQPIHFQ